MALKCTGCGYENEPTRVYCHNCGEKLERGEASTALPGGFTPPEQTHEAKPQRRQLALGSYFYALIKLCILAAVILMLVQAFLPPVDLPAPVAADETRAAGMSDSVRRASASHSPVAFKFTAAEVDKWFVSNAHFKKSQSFVVLQPKRVYADLGNGTVRLGIEASLPGAGRMVFQADYLPVRVDGAYFLQPLSYSVGRLVLPVFLGWPVQRQFDGLTEALAAPLAQLAQASEIKITPDAVTLRWSGDKR